MPSISPSTIFCYYSNQGRLTHRIYRFLTMVQFAMQHKVDVCYPFFATFLALFEPLRDQICLGYSPRTDGVSSPELAAFYQRILRHPFNTLVSDVVKNLISDLSRDPEKLPSKASDALTLTVICELFGKGLPSGDFLPLAFVGEGQSMEENDLSSSRMLDRIPEAPHVFFSIDDTTYSSGEYLKEALDVGRRLFQPRAEAVLRQNSFFDSSCTGADVLVGVHIRHSDFKHFANGIWYFPTSDYYQAMIATREFFGTSKVRFLIASDEPVLADSFSALDIVKAPGHTLDDLYLLSRCDYLIGTDSGYVRWASTYGKKPLFRLERGATLPTSLSDFVLVG